MGGNALKQVQTRRVRADEFYQLAAEVIQKVSPFVVDARITRCYAGKPDFGDMDVLVSYKPNDNPRVVVGHAFNPQEMVCNGDVISFDYKGVQIDFIKTPAEIMPCSYAYFSYNDLHNFIGRIARHMGFKWGHRGLFMVFDLADYEPGVKSEYYEEVLISQNPRKILEFLGFNYDRHEAGFNDLEDIFNYVINSKYFNPEVFAYENLDAMNRKRNKKRMNYGLFLKYLEQFDQFEIEEGYQFKPVREYHAEAEEFFGFPVRELIENYKVKALADVAFRSKFNGDLVSRLSGRVHKSLGELMIALKEIPNFREFVLNSPEDVIHSRIVEEHKRLDK